MSTRIRDENAVHAHHHGQLKKQQITKKSNENSSITRPTLASSAKVKPELKSKGSRPVLAPLAKSTNLTPGQKGVAPSKEKPKPLASKLGTTITQTPRPVKKVLPIPKSTKKTINVYTPARPSVHVQDRSNEVEHSHPKPPEDGPPTPIRNALFSPADVLEDDIEPEMVEQQPLGFSDDLRTLGLVNPAPSSRPGV